VALLAAVIGLPPLRGLFELEPIEPAYWPVLAAFPPIFLAAEEGRKLVARSSARRKRLVCVGAQVSRIRRERV